MQVANIPDGHARGFAVLREGVDKKPVGIGFRFVPDRIEDPSAYILLQDWEREANDGWAAVYWDGEEKEETKKEERHTQTKGAEKGRADRRRWRECFDIQEKLDLGLFMLDDPFCLDKSRAVMVGPDYCASRNNQYFRLLCHFCEGGAGDKKEDKDSDKKRCLIPIVFSGGVAAYFVLTRRTTNEKGETKADGKEQSEMTFALWYYNWEKPPRELNLASQIGPKVLKLYCGESTIDVAWIRVSLLWDITMDHGMMKLVDSFRPVAHNYFKATILLGDNIKDLLAVKNADQKKMFFVDEEDVIEFIENCNTRWNEEEEISDDEWFDVLWLIGERTKQQKEVGAKLASLRKKKRKGPK